MVLCLLTKNNVHLIFRERFTSHVHFLNDVSKMGIDTHDDGSVQYAAKKVPGWISGGVVGRGGVFLWWLMRSLI